MCLFRYDRYKFFEHARWSTRMGRLFPESGIRGRHHCLQRRRSFYAQAEHCALQLYIVDQVARARSPWQQAVDGSQLIFDVPRTEARFTATANFDLWPAAHLHTQWVGNGSQSDPTFDSFYASMVPSLADPVESSQKVLNAAVELLDKIGVHAYIVPVLFEFALTRGL